MLGEGEVQTQTNSKRFLNGKGSDNQTGLGGISRLTSASGEAFNCDYRWLATGGGGTLRKWGKRGVERFICSDHDLYGEKHIGKLKSKKDIWKKKNLHSSKWGRKSRFRRDSYRFESIVRQTEKWRVRHHKGQHAHKRTNSNIEISSLS